MYRLLLSLAALRWNTQKHKHDWRRHPRSSLPSCGWLFTTAADGGGLPSPWANEDVGDTGLGGNASFAGGVFTVSGSGADIWGSADALPPSRLTHG